MKSILPIAVVCLFCAAAAFSQTDSAAATQGAQGGIDSSLLSGPTDKEVLLYGGSAVSYLPGDFKDLSHRGWSAGGGVGISFAPGDVGYGALFFTLDAARFPFNPEGYRNLLLRQFPTDDPSLINNGVITRRGTTKFFSAMVLFKGVFLSPSKQSIAPYFLLGGGFIHASSDTIAMKGQSAYTIAPNSESGFGWRIGVGIEIPFLERFAIFGQGESVLAVLKDTRQYFPITGGLRVRLR